MSQKIFNTATRKKEIFQPIKEGAVGIYVCGITAYDVCHVGHARAAVVFDVVVRYLRTRGYQVTYVKNFTDIDDKIIDRAKKEGVSITEISERYIKLHDEDMAALGVETPTVTPKATEHMEDMIALIGVLEKKGYAYCVDGDVYFAINNYSNTAVFPDGIWKKWLPERALMSMIKKKILWILRSGKKARKVNLSGKAPGERAGRAGISNVPP